MDPPQGRATRAGQVILLNSASSSGKTTLARALQASLDEAYYLVQLDAFEDMIPGRLLTGTQAEYDALTTCARAMPRSIAYLARSGANVIADHVFLDAPGFATWLWTRTRSGWTRACPWSGRG